MSFLESLDDLRETQRLEMKEAAGGLPDDVWESYSAMANTEGGEIVLGVHEDKSAKAFTIVGIDDPEGMIAQFWSIVRNTARVERDVMLYDGVHPVAINGKDVVVIEVPKAGRGEKPVKVYDRKTKSFVAWVRRDEGDYKASEDDLRLMSYDNVPGADRKPLERFGIDSLCDETINRYRNVFSGRMPHSPWNGDSKEDFLYHIGALAKGRSGELRPTQAGLVAFGYEYEITNYLPQFLLDFREETSDDDRWDDRVVSQSGDWSGNAIDFYYAVTGKLLRHFKAPFATDETGTVHGSRNPVTEAVNEVVANALIHADYGASSGAGVRIILTGDALAADNPGTLLIERDVAIAGGFSEPRNPTLMRIFSFIGASDRAGSGLEMVFRTWKDLYGKQPLLEEKHSPSGVRLSLPLGGPSMKQSGKRGGSGGLEHGSLLGILAGSPGGMTSREVHELTGASERVAQKRLKELFDLGRLARTKEGHSWRYSLRDQ